MVPLIKHGYQREALMVPHKAWVAESGLDGTRQKALVAERPLKARVAEGGVDGTSRNARIPKRGLDGTS